MGQTLNMCSNTNYDDPEDGPAAYINHEHKIRRLQ